MKRTLAVLLTLLVVAPGVAPLAAAAGSPPSGFAGVPNSNVSAEMPDGQNPPIPASRLEGKVLTTAHASTTKVTLTTPARAEELMAGNGSVVGAGDVAFVISDDTNHGARKVALPGDAVEDALGYTPMEVRGLHDSGDRWTRQVTNQNGYLVFEVPKFSTNTVTFTGVVELTGAPASDGASYAYEVSDPDAVENFNITLTGSTATEWDNESFIASNGGSGSISVAGTTSPTGPSANGEPVVVFEGQTSTSMFTASGTASNGGTKTIDIGGNQPPANESITISGDTTFTTRSQSGTAADGGTASISVGGNAAPEQADGTQPAITFTGRSATSPASKSGTGATSGYSTSVSVGGDGAPQNVDVTFTGNVQTANGDSSGSGYGDHSITIGGNINPTGPSSNSEPTIEVTGSKKSVTKKLDDGSNVNTNKTWSASNLPSNLDTLTVHIEGHDGSSSTNNWALTAYVDGSQVDSASGGVFSTNNKDVTLNLGSGVNPSSSVTLHYNLDTYVYINDVTYHTLPPRNVDVTGPSGTYTLGDFSNGQTKTQELSGLTDGSNTVSISGTSGAIDYTIHATERTATEDPSLDVDDDGTPDASYTGILSSGQTATTSVSGLNTGSQTLGFDLAAGSVDWSLSYDETHYTNSPSVSLASGGGASVSGDIAPGNTVTKSLGGLSTGSNSLSFAMNGPASADWTVDWTERNQTTNPAVDTNNDGTDDAVVAGQLADGETATQSVSLSVDTQTLAFSAGGSNQFEYNLTADEVTSTSDPAVDLDNDGTFDVTHVGTLSEGETITKEAPSISTQTSTIGVSTNNSKVAVHVKLKERTQTQDVTVEVNGNTTSYAGTLTDGESQTIQTDPGWIQSGTNQVNVTIGSGAGEAPPPEVGFEYRHDSLDRQTVEYQAEAWSERYNVSKTFGGSRSNAELTIPFAGEVLAVRAVERKQADGTWTDVGSANRELNGTTLTVDLGSVSAGESVAVRAVGSKARVTGGEIQVTKPTVAGNTLDSTVKLLSWGPDAYISVPQQGSYGLIHYAYQESWTGANDEVTVEADGDQRLYMPAAPAGGTTQVTTLPVAAEPATGEVVVSVTNSPSNSEPSWQVKPGSSVGDDVQYTFVEAVDGKQYILYDESADIVLDSGEANSPLTLSDDDSESTLSFRVDDGSATSSGGGTGAVPGPVPESASGFINSIPGVLIVATLLIVGLFVVFRRMGWTDDGGILPINDVLGVAIGLIGFVVIDYVSGRVLTKALGVTLEQVGPLAGIIGTLLLAWYLYKEYIKGAGPRPIVFRGGGGS